MHYKTLPTWTVPNDPVPRHLLIEEQSRPHVGHRKATMDDLRDMCAALTTAQKKELLATLNGAI